MNEIMPTFGQKFGDFGYLLARKSGQRFLKSVKNGHFWSKKPTFSRYLYYL